MTMQKGPFRKLKRSLLRPKTDRFGTRNGMYCRAVEYQIVTELCKIGLYFEKN